jgi:hypothetical protein
MPSLPTHVVPGPPAELLSRLLPPALHVVASLQVSLGAGQMAAGLLLRQGVDIDPWWSSLTDEERRDCRLLFPRRVASFLEDLAALDEENDPEDEGWQEDLLDLCERYDLLSCWGLLLSSRKEHSPDHETGRLNGRMSAAMQRMLFSLYMELNWESRPHLAAVASQSPDAWWVRPGAPLRRL